MGKKNKVQQKKKNVLAAKPSPSNKISLVGNIGLKNMTPWLLIITSILPFLHSEKLIDPTAPIRYVALGIFVFVFVVSFFINAKRPFPSALPLYIKITFLAGFAFAVWSLISSMNAINPKEGFYIISRHLLLLLFLFIVMYIIIHEEKQLIKIAKVLVVAGILQSMVGILQFYGAAFTELPGNFIPYGLMANRNLFGSAQVLLIPFCLLVLQQGNKGWKYIAGISLLLLLISVFFSQTRSAWIAVALLFIVSFILVMIFLPVNRRKWVIGSAAVLVTISAVIGLLMLSNSNEEFSKSIKERAASLTQHIPDSTLERQNIDERFKIWNKTIQVIKRNSLMGVGPGNWRIAIPAFGTAGMAWEHGRYVPDQPHNDYLQTASETGIPGAILYFGMWLLIAVIGLKFLLNSPSQQNKMIVILMLAGMAGFAADSLFSFPGGRMEHMFYLTLMSGIILGLYYNLISTEKKEQPFPRSWTWTMVTIAAFNIFIGIKKYNFEIHLNRAMAFDKMNQPAAVLEEVKKGTNSYITLDPVGKSLPLYSCMAYKETGNYAKALQEGNLALKYHPNSAGVYQTIGTVYTDMKEYDKAIEYYKKALKLTPKATMTLNNLAINYFQLKKYKECIQTLEKVKWQEDDYLKSLYENAKTLMNNQQQQ